MTVIYGKCCWCLLEEKTTKNWHVICFMLLKTCLLLWLKETYNIIDSSNKCVLLLVLSFEIAFCQKDVEERRFISDFLLTLHLIMITQELMVSIGPFTSSLSASPSCCVNTSWSTYSLFQGWCNKRKCGRY